MPFYQTNPPILSWKTAAIRQGYNGLHNRILPENAGFVLENEPTGPPSPGRYGGLVRLGGGLGGGNGECVAKNRRSQTAATTETVEEGPLYDSAKRTHFKFEDFFMYFRYPQVLMYVCSGVCKWVRSGKRTHF